MGDLAWLSAMGQPAGARYNAQAFETRNRTELQPKARIRQSRRRFCCPKTASFSIISSSRATSRRRTKRPQEQTFQQSAPGRYEAKFIPSQRGIHFLTLYAEGEAGEAPLPVATVPYIAPYPKEYRELKPNMALLSRLAEETGGEMLDPDKIEEGISGFTRRRREKGDAGRKPGGRLRVWDYFYFSLTWC